MTPGTPGDPPDPEGGMTPRPNRTARRISAMVGLLQATVLLAFAMLYVVEVVNGSTDDPVRAVMSMVLIVVFAAGLAALAWYWWAGADWPRTPTIVWDVLLLPVAWSLHQSGQDLIGLAVGVVAIAGLVAAVGVTPTDRASSGEDRPEG